jgi:hypothetical protein
MVLIFFRSSFFPVWVWGKIFTKNTNYCEPARSLKTGFVLKANSTKNKISKLNPRLGLHMGFHSATKYPRFSIPVSFSVFPGILLNLHKIVQTQFVR